ncbi:MAG: hypothetical protein JO197_12325 [Acidobacteria bacterium]|nr:hypothetical protein [Acidobacteriota bacterium]MBV9478344.1 hypothetical protein [Acidobacteriota bacterium]
MSKTRFLASITAILALSRLAFAQATDPQTPPPAPPPTSVTTTQPSVLSDAASATYERRDSLPAVNIYLPEGQASIRLRKLIRNVLFESQIDYRFVNGDISTFLRYKYYARNYTYRLGVFDSISFPDVGSDDQKEFERVRGGLLLFGIPKDYNNRYFLLLQDDRLTFGINRPDNLKNNIYTKIGYQYGTQFDERMNAIVGEQRGRITPVLTAFRDIGPQKTGLAAAITQSSRVANGDYQYTKLEAEGLHRFDLTPTSFVFSRLHVGAFLKRDLIEPPPVPTDKDGDMKIDPLEPWEFYDVPQYELFRLGGREALRSIATNGFEIGTHETHMTHELFVPVFRNRDYHLGSLYWNTAYAVGYFGAGAVGFNYSDMVKSKRLVADVGLGTESAFAFRDYDIYLSLIVAHTLKHPDDIDAGTKVRFSIRTVR